MACSTTMQISWTCSEVEVKTLNDIDWDSMGFAARPTDFMFVMKCERGGQWGKGEMRPFGNLELSPSAAILNYGQGLYEGLKAQRAVDGRVLLFRPEQNALRLMKGADRMSMPAPPVHAFLDAVKQTICANKRWIPPLGKGSLYVRPLLFGSGPVLGLAPAPDYMFVVFVIPVGTYFKGGMKPIDIKVETYYKRAFPGGTGGVKAVGNYSPVVKALLHAKDNGHTDVLYLDVLENKYIEELSACNIFIAKGKKLSTPDLIGTILPGITRSCIIELAKNFGYEEFHFKKRLGVMKSLTVKITQQVEERPIAVDELLDADEAFCTGTAVVVTCVGSVTYNDKRVNYKNGGHGEVAQQLYKALTDIQLGKAEDKHGWTMQLSLE